MRENLHNVFLRVEPVEGEVNTGAAAARRIWGSIRKGRVESVAKSDISSAMSNLGDVGEWATDHAYCGVEPAAYTVGARVEPDPHPESRVTLTNEKDALGMPIANLHWAISDDVKRSTFRTLELFAREVGKHNIGRMRIFFDPTAPWPEWPDMEVGFHHCSTTRMSDTPKTGVVDRNCRVHGVSNLYVAGSSVFSTAGSGSPTMMLTALALRLADHIKADMG
jgi:choline dehydrogenase-like flavoprotein